MEVEKRNIVILSLSLVMICTVTFCAKFVKYIDITALKVIVHIFLNLSNGLIALIAMKLTNMKINIAPKKALRKNLCKFNNCDKKRYCERLEKQPLKFFTG